MTNAWALLLRSRKFWTGLIAVLAIAAAVTLRALGLLPADALLPTIAAIATLGTSIILGTAAEDAAQKLGGIFFEEVEDSGDALTPLPTSPISSVEVIAPPTDKA